MWMLALLVAVTAIAVALAARRRRTVLPSPAQRLSARIEPHL
jgi:hypothetical protein